MKLKLALNASESQEDYKLLKSALSTVASLRRTAVLRFTSERLVIISTPGLPSNSSSILGDTGQLWCTIPRDIFTLYNVVSARDLNTIAMECSCDALLNVFKKYDAVISQGTNGTMTIKLQSMPEWNVTPLLSGDVGGKNGANGGGSSSSKPNPVCALGITFEEVVHRATGGRMGTTSISNTGTSKFIAHSFKIPAKLLFKAQDSRIQEPMVNYSQLLMYRLPAPQGEWGRGFSNFIRRIERYTTVQNVKLSGKGGHGESADRQRDFGLALIVNELDWYLEICWNGPLEVVPQPQNGESEAHSQPEFTSIDDTSPLTALNDSEPGTEDNSVYEVVLKRKDWKVCGKLYEGFEDVVLAISHDESCVFHCSLSRNSVDDEGQEKNREQGQVIYYMARARRSG
ncbi:LAMI_0G06282g1_1 [Lachancea mirantina]|uniref:LAMI_0G06282g1_1 n=1 Tax=Lachancea mirantina TaxID=1230905 RepID=A0A1G4K987_9SACH|nr:LAMI_0G06282g1_1 [Lachancea mirantina]